jgi:hypothetical protein
MHAIVLIIIGTVAIKVNSIVGEEQTPICLQIFMDWMLHSLFHRKTRNHVYYNTTPGFYLILYLISNTWFSCIFAILRPVLEAEWILLEAGRR